MTAVAVNCDDVVVQRIVSLIAPSFVLNLDISHDLSAIPVEA